MSKRNRLTIQYVNVLPQKKIVSVEDIYTYELTNMDKIILVNVDDSMAFDYTLLIAVDKMVSALESIERVALIRSNHIKYIGFQIIIEGNIQSDKSLIPKFICWEKLENHQKTIEDLLPIYED